MVLDNERCRVDGCTLHVDLKRTTPNSERNLQIRQDWESGFWSTEELSYFWGLKPRAIRRIVSHHSNSAIAEFEASL